MIAPLSDRELAGIPFATASLSEATQWLCSRSLMRVGGADIHLLNAYSVALAETDASFRECILAASCNFPDGKPISVLSKLTTRPLYQVRGPSLFERVMDEGRQHNLRHYLLGSTPRTLELLRASLEARYPGVEIVGFMSPPFRTLSKAEYDQQDKAISAAEPDIVWVGLGTPKQDFEARRLAVDGGFVAVAVGAAFDFAAGTKKCAPEWMSKIGVEWIFRLASEPKRLWRRYLIGNFVFLYSAVRRGI
ncbi:WecB/TagA/CpsF family glycosyltransferase [Arthrobacter sp. DNA4]|uniref:WecB/TagA/CpsF family glycosyltransferase n=1 Tax=Micrococcaceae TaxID=1268 RepID=UPI0020CEBAC8|nr:MULTISPECIES: WecB/TagA/CpsF family glycosyltransferase [Micrococcaceae]UTT68798.1 WecB/TagA/CpsF family glycosyltransferase [Arthrobacter sp. DNA4]WRT13046.1 WecB/TagA/CpsF family glycosyltransferase [Pseudarthrobacter sp. LT1]